MDQPVGSDPAEDGGIQMNEPLVSIIIPTYNYAHLIVQTLESVRTQRFTDWECMIIDDGSTDLTAQVISEYFELHPGYAFSYVPISNSGTSAAKNQGLRLAKGTYIQFLDADDLLTPDKLAVQVAQLEAGGGGLCFSRSRFFRVLDGQKHFEDKYPDGFLAQSGLTGAALISKLVTNNIVTISSPLVRASLISAAGVFDEDLLNNEDWLFWFRIAVCQPDFRFDADPLSAVQVRLHGSSAMNQHKKMFQGEVVVRHQIEKLLRDLPESLRISYAEQQQLLKLNADLLALHQVRSLQIQQGMSYIIGSFVRHPYSEYPLLFKGCLKLMVRIYKKLWRG